MLHIHSSESTRCGVAGWLPGRRRNDLPLSECLEVEAGRTQHAPTAKSRARARTLSPLDRAHAYGCSYLRSRIQSPDVDRGETQFPESDGLGSHASRQTTAVPNICDGFCRSASGTGRNPAVSRDQTRPGRGTQSLYRDCPVTRSASAVHGRATRDCLIPSSPSNARESAAKLDGAGQWPSSREGSETSG